METREAKNLCIIYWFILTTHLLNYHIISIIEGTVQRTIVVVGTVTSVLGSKIVNHMGYRVDFLGAEIWVSFCIFLFLLHAYFVTTITQSSTPHRPYVIYVRRRCAMVYPYVYIYCIHPCDKYPTNIEYVFYTYTHTQYTHVIYIQLLIKIKKQRRYPQRKVFFFIFMFLDDKPFRHVNPTKASNHPV